MKIRLLAFLAVLVLVAGMVPVAAAQDQTADQQKVNCLNLSADDCTIVQTAMDNLSKMNSFTPTLSLTETLAGAEAVAPGMVQDNSADIKATGAVVVDHSAMTGDTPYKGASVSFDITGTTTTAGKTDPVDVSFVLVDGTVYWQDNGKWQGVAVEDMVNYFKNGGSLPNMSFMGMGMPSGMMQGMMGQMGQMGQLGQIGAKPTGTPGAMSLDSSSLMALLEIPGFVKQERLADDTSMGSPMQVFAYTGDIGVVLQSAEVQKAISDALSSAMSSGGSSSPAGGMAMMIPALMDSTTGSVTLTRWIGADDQFLHQVELSVDASIDLYGGTTSSKVTPIPPITLKLDVTLNMDKINDTAAPTAPADATIVKPQDLFPSAESTPESTPAQ